MRSHVQRVLLHSVLCFSVTHAAVAQWIVSSDNGDTDRFRRHKDNFFFITSTSQWSEVKFQFSIKYRLMDKSGLNLGFTQKSFWNMWDFGLSSPFTESNYNPEIFYDFCEGNPGQSNLYRLGVEHESNGKAGAESRSLNRVYATAYFPIVPDIVWLQPKLWFPVIIEKENADIRQFEVQPCFASIDDLRLGFN